MRRGHYLWKPVIVVVLVAAVLTCLVAGVGAGDTGHHHANLACGLLPDAGALDLLPSSSTHLLVVAECPGALSDPLLCSLPPRGPPA